MKANISNKDSIDLRQVNAYETFMKKEGWEIIKIPIKLSQKCHTIFLWKINHTPFSFIRAYRINVPIPFREIENLRLKYKTISVRIEPNILVRDINKQILGEFDKFHYVRDSWCHFPSKTIEVNLQEPLGVVLKKMQKKTVYNIKLAIKRGVKIKKYTGNYLFKYNNILELYSTLLKQRAKQLNISQYPLRWLKSLVKCFDKKLILLLAYLNNELIGGSLFITTDTRLYYVQSCSSELGRKNDAPSLLIFEAIKEGQERNLKSLDLEGIYDERYHSTTNKWKGFSSFKAGFGGETKEYVGSYVKYSKFHFNRLNQFYAKLFASPFLPSLYPEDLYVYNKYELKLRELLKIKNIYEIT